MQKKSKIYMGLLQFVVVVAVVIFTFILSESLKPEQKIKSGFARGKGGQPMAPIVTTVKAEPVPSYKPQITVNAVVAATADTDVVPQVTGRVIKVSPNFKSGGQFKKGDHLFEIEKLDYQLALEQSRAEVAAARSDYLFQKAKAEIAVQDWKKLFPGKAITPLGARQPQVDAAKARLDRAVALEKSAALALKRTVITAPFDGRVINSRLAVGQIVAANQSVGKIYAFSNVELMASISERDHQILSPVVGRSTKAINVGEGDPSLTKGQVVRGISVLDDQTRLGQIFIKPEKPALLTPGSFMSVTIAADPVVQAYQLPAAVVSMGQVWVVQNDRLETKALSILGYQGDHVIVRPFDGADQVVTAVPSGLMVGHAVTIKPLDVFDLN